MKGGKQLRRVVVGSTEEFGFRTADIVLNDYHVRPEDILSVCMYGGKVYVYYLSES